MIIGVWLRDEWAVDRINRFLSVFISWQPAVASTLFTLPELMTVLLLVRWSCLLIGTKHKVMWVHPLGNMHINSLQSNSCSDYFSLYQSGGQTNMAIPRVKRKHSTKEWVHWRSWIWFLLQHRGKRFQVEAPSSASEPSNLKVCINPDILQQCRNARFPRLDIYNGLSGTSRRLIVESSGTTTELRGGQTFELIFSSGSSTPSNQLQTNVQRS